MTGGRQPSFFLAGVAKSGTTSLWWMLRENPNIFLPSRKEPNHFSPELDSVALPEFRPLTRSEYRALYRDASPDQVCGEASVAYIESPEAMARIASFDPDARIVLLFREPMACVHSHHQQMLHLGIEDHRDLGEALALEDERRAGQRLPAGAHGTTRFLQYRERVRFTDKLDRAFAVFPEDQVLCVLLDDLNDDTDTTMARISQFIGAEDAGGHTRLHVNRTPALPWHHPARRSTGLDRIRWRGSIPRVLFEPPPRFLGRTRFKPPQPPRSEVVAALREELRPEVAAFGRRIGRDLSTLWGYGAPDGPPPDSESSVITMPHS